MLNRILYFNLTSLVIYDAAHHPTTLNFEKIRTFFLLREIYANNVKGRSNRFTYGFPYNFIFVIVVNYYVYHAKP